MKKPERKGERKTEGKRNDKKSDKKYEKRMLKKIDNKSKDVAVNKEKIKIIPLGGLEQIGMNITAFEYGDSIVVVDCGLAFPEDDMLGIDLVIPDVSYLKENAHKVKGLVITHGHEDHIGAIPFVENLTSRFMQQN